MSHKSRPEAVEASTVITVQQGDCAVSAEPEVVFSTVLGSCIATCVRDVVARVGGMNHFLLPEYQGFDADGLTGASARYGAYAMERLINKVLAAGTGRKANLEFKIFGGGRINPALNDVGAENIAFVRTFLKTENYTLLAEDVGNVFSRRVMFWPGSGRALVKRLGSADNVVIGKSELRARPAESRRESSVDIELF